MAITKGPTCRAPRNKFEGCDKLDRIRNRDCCKFERWTDVRYTSAAKILTWWRRWNNERYGESFRKLFKKVKGITYADYRMTQYQRMKRIARYFLRRTIPAAKILTWWRRWKTSSKSKDTATVSPKVEIMLGYKQRVYYDGCTRQFPCIKYFRLYYPKDIRNKTNKPEIVTNVNKNAQQNEIHHVNTVGCKKLTVPFVVDTPDGKNLPPDVQTNQQNNTGILSNYYEQHDIRNNDNNFFDEKAKPDVLYYVNTNTKNAQQNEIHHVNTVCCKKLLSKEDIIQNHSHRAITLKFNQARVYDVYNDKSTLKTVPFVVDTSDGKNLPPDVQTNQQNIREQKPKIHHLPTLQTRDNFVHCNHNLLSSKTMVAMNSPLGNSKPPNFGKPMDYSHHFHRVCYTGFRPTCAYGVLACGGA